MAVGRGARAPDYGQPPGAYRGGGSPGDRTLRLDGASVQRVFEPSGPAAEGLHAEGAATPDYHELDAANGGAEAFYRAIAGAKYSGRTIRRERGPQNDASGERTIRVCVRNRQLSVHTAVPHFLETNLH